MPVFLAALLPGRTSISLHQMLCLVYSIQRFLGLIKPPIYLALIREVCQWRLQQRGLNKDRGILPVAGSFMFYLKKKFLIAGEVLKTAS